MYGDTAAPPPTPSSLSSNHDSTSSATVDALSRLLHRLPPALSLSLPTRRSPSVTCPPVVSLSDPNSNDCLLSAASQLGYFQLTNHHISSKLAGSADSESLSLFQLERNDKETYFPKNWPLGFDPGDDEEEENDDGGNRERNDGSFCLDSTCSTESTELNLTSLREFTLAMEKVGLNIIEMLARAVGFDDPIRFSSLMWISQQGLRGDKQVLGGFYPYIVGLQYQIRNQKYSLLSDSGSVIVSPQVDSVLVSIGDIAQVWSNGKLKKVRGRPTPCFENEDKFNKNKSRNSLSMTLLVTLPVDSTVSPLIPKVNDDEEDDEEEGTRGSHPEESNIVKKDKEEDEITKVVFQSFAFEDYAWRLYHERLLFKDPLDRYRI